ncbi:MAG: hypothetical protein CL674_16130 [Bdellovibrionaceae bacterium]|nr:hypothetical protein [Pseudobdellovibrionaceae bacterium]|tara:strand:+ start:37576 stop:38685 length:1110 start_codon:yes stop_codon:yes gene_type:complete
MRKGNFNFIFYLCIGVLLAPFAFASSDYEVYESYFLGDKYERHISKKTGKLIASFIEGKSLDEPLLINSYEDPQLLESYLNSMADNFRLFDYSFFNHPQAVRITSVKGWVNYRLKYHLEKILEEHFVDTSPMQLSERAKIEIKRVADSIPHTVVKNVFLHSLLDRVFRLNLQSPAYYFSVSKFLKSIGYSNNPAGFIGVGHCQILRRSLAAVNYCFDDKSILEKHLESNNIEAEMYSSYISRARERNMSILEIFESSLKGLGLQMNQVICEDFDSRVFSTAQAGQPKSFYYRRIYSNQVYADYFLVDKYLGKFLMGNTENFNTLKAHRGGFYSNLKQAGKNIVLSISGVQAREGFTKCVKDELEYYQEL